MKIPNTGRRRALFVIDVQPAFLTEDNKYVIENILQLLDTEKYYLYVLAEFSADKNTMWHEQQNWTCPYEPTEERILNKLKSIGTFTIKKNKRSIFDLYEFKSSSSVQTLMSLESMLIACDIEEVHVIGLDTNDCVLASALDSFDKGFYTYVIEECCQSSGGQKLHEMSLELLRHQEMTNHSIIK